MSFDKNVAGIGKVIFGLAAGIWPRDYHVLVYSGKTCHVK